MIGWISVHKKIREHWLWEDPKYFKAWMDMLMMANYSDVKKPYRDKVVTIKRGEFPSSFRALALRWGWSKNTVIKFINRLKADTMVDTHTEFGFTVVKIVNYEKYQGQADTVVDTVGGTVGGTVSGTPGGTTIIKDNKINKRNNSGVAKNSTPTLKDRFAIFSKKVNKVGKEKGLPKQEIDKFIDHWGAHNEGGKKMRWEMEKVFDMSRRMNTWKANVNAFSFSNGNSTQNVMVQPKEVKKTKYICYGCDKEKEQVGRLSAEETFCSCGDQYLMEWEYIHRKKQDKFNTIENKKVDRPMSDAEILEKVGFKMRTIA